MARYEAIRQGDAFVLHLSNPTRVIEVQPRALFPLHVCGKSKLPVIYVEGLGNLYEPTHAPTIRLGNYPQEGAQPIVGVYLVDEEELFGGWATSLFEPSLSLSDTNPYPIEDWNNISIEIGSWIKPERLPKVGDILYRKLKYGYVLPIDDKYIVKKTIAKSVDAGGGYTCKISRVV